MANYSNNCVDEIKVALRSSSLVIDETGRNRGAFGSRKRKERWLVRVEIIGKLPVGSTFKRKVPVIKKVS